MSQRGLCTKFCANQTNRCEVIAQIVFSSMASVRL